MSLRERAAVAALQGDLIDNPPTHIVTRQAVYSVPLGTTPSTIPFSGTTSRLVVKFDTAGIGLGSMPYKIEIPYKRVGNPSGTLKVGSSSTSNQKTFRRSYCYHTSKWRTYLDIFRR